MLAEESVNVDAMRPTNNPTKGPDRFHHRLEKWSPTAVPMMQQKMLTLMKVATTTGIGIDL